MHQTLGKNYGYSDHMPNVCIYGQLPSRDNNDEDLRIQSPCPSNWSDDLLEIDNSKAESKEQTEQPANDVMTLKGTRVPQDVLAHASTTLRLPQTMPQALKIQEQNNKITNLNRMANPNKRLDLLTRLGHGKGHKNKMNRNKNEDNGRKKNGKVF